MNRLTGKPDAVDYRAVIDAIARRDQARILIDGMTTAANDPGLSEAVPGRVTRRKIQPKIRPKSSHGTARAAMVANVDHEVLAMDHKTTFSYAAAAIAASLAMAMSTGALGACKTTLRGELVQAPGGGQAFPLEFLFFSLSETTQDSGTSTEKPLKRFQSFIVPNTRTTLPIPFALDIDQPKDCPSELELSVGTDRTDQPDPTPRFRYNNDHVLLTGRKTIHLDRFESIPVWGPRF